MVRGLSAVLVLKVIPVKRTFHEHCRALSLVSLCVASYRFVSLRDASCLSLGEDQSPFDGKWCCGCASMLRRAYLHAMVTKAMVGVEESCGRHAVSAMISSQLFADLR